MLVKIKGNNKTLFFDQTPQNIDPWMNQIEEILTQNKLNDTNR